MVASSFAASHGVRVVGSGRASWAASYLLRPPGQKPSTAAEPGPSSPSRDEQVAEGTSPDDPGAMDNVEKVLAPQSAGDVFVRAEVLSLGYDDKAIARQVRGRAWTRVRPGAYTSVAVWEAADEEQRHRMRSLAVMRSLGDRVALSHTSAVVAHGLLVWGADLSRVHVTRLDEGAGRTEPDLVHHECACFAGDVTRHAGHWVTTPARAALETASLLDVERGLVVLDSALNTGAATVEELLVQHHRMAQWPGTQHLQVTVRLADAGAESVGESRLRHLCWAQGLPAPCTQFQVRDELGCLVARVDLAWPEHRLLVEFDGRAKYGRLLGPGRSPGDAVFEEKRREDRIRELLPGWSMLRVTWDDLAHPGDTAQRIRRRLNRAA